MEARQMIEKASHRDFGFKVMTEFDGWKIGMLRYSERFSRLGELERHLLTDEVFVLMSGKATLYTDREAVEMEPYAVYPPQWRRTTADASFRSGRTLP